MREPTKYKSADAAGAFVETGLRAVCKVAAYAALAPLLGGLALGPAMAQQDGPSAPRLQTVEDATGIRTGSFLVRPELSLDGTYSDNYLQESSGDEEDSFLIVTRPEVIAESDWNRHQLTVGVFTEYGLYTAESDDNFFNYGGSAVGILDITRAMGLRAGAGLSRLTESRGSDNSANGAEEGVEYTLGTFDLEGRYKAGMIRISPVGAISLRDYDDVDLIGGGTSNQDDRDRISYVYGLEIGYEFLRGYEAFVRGEGLGTEYDQDEDDTGVARSSDGYKVLTGVNVGLSRLIEGRLGVGYETRDYDDEDLDSSEGVSLDLGVDWFVTPLTSINFQGEGGIGETTVAGASGTVTYTGTVSVKHALRRDVLIGAFATAGTEDFEGIDRTDDLLSAGASVEWLLNPHFSVGARYSHVNEDSTADNQDYSENIFSLGLKARY